MDRKWGFSCKSENSRSRSQGNGDVGSGEIGGGIEGFHVAL